MGLRGRDGVTVPPHRRCPAPRALAEEGPVLPAPSGGRDSGGPCAAPPVPAESLSTDTECRAAESFAPPSLSPAQGRDSGALLSAAWAGKWAGKTECRQPVLRRFDSGLLYFTVAPKRCSLRSGLTLNSDLVPASRRRQDALPGRRTAPQAEAPNPASEHRGE